MKKIICAILLVTVILSVFLLASCDFSSSSKKRFIVLNSQYYQQHVNPERTVIVNADFISNILADKFEGQECFVVEYFLGDNEYYYYLTVEEAKGVFEQLGIEMPENVYFGK